MTKRSFQPRRLPALAALALAAACVSGGPRAADRLYFEGDLAGAARAYHDYLDGPVDDLEAAARARYRLAVIYALSGEAEDWELAVATLEELVTAHSGTRWADQATLLLSLHRERQELEQELGDQQHRASRLLGQVLMLQDEAARAGDEATSHQERVDALAAAIAALRSEIGRLSEQLEARKAELDELKRIDLEPPP